MKNENVGKNRLNEAVVRLKVSEGTKLYSTERIGTPEQAVKVMAKAMAELDREHICVVNLDGTNRPINFSVVSIGDIDASQIAIRNLFKSAILTNAASLIIFHNHPSGEAYASPEDIKVTKNIIKAGKLLGIDVEDHVIVGAYTGNIYSMRQWYANLFRR